jgi:hypothetical protein
MISERIKSLFRRHPPPTAEELAAHAEVESLPDRAREAARLDAQRDAHRATGDGLAPPPYWISSRRFLRAALVSRGAARSAGPVFRNAP